MLAVLFLKHKLKQFLTDGPAKMVSDESQNHGILLWFTCLIAVFFIAFTSGCTVKHAALQSGTIPNLGAPSPRAEKYGKSLYENICKKYELDTESRQYEKLVDIFSRLTLAAEVDHLPWHVYLIDAPETVDIRAVHGNYIFVWSGTMETVEDDDELAGLLACELSHVLARHTDPVKYTLATELLFATAELATSVGVMVASQGAVAISGLGWMKWAYTEIADLDSMDRVYSEDFEREAADIALLTICRAGYSPQALLDFWERAVVDETTKKYDRFSRSLAPEQRAAMLESIIGNLPEEENLLAKKIPGN